MKAFVVIATKDRPVEVSTLLDYLAEQTYPIEKVFVVGSKLADIQHLENHKLVIDLKVILTLSSIGSCVQRNAGLFEISKLNPSKDRNWFVVFFDDDFRPASNWIEQCADLFVHDQECVGIGGHVIADGVTIGTISEEAAQLNLAGFGKCSKEKVEAHYGLYGCNMAYRGNVAATIRFDENLPLYAWQEDIDFGARAKAFGKLYYYKNCIGVHLGSSSGRTSGVRFGYSQIANPIYLLKKSTMTKKFAYRLMRRNIAANIFNAVTFKQDKDYFGRLRGNIKALWHLLQGKCNPRNILKF